MDYQKYDWLGIVTTIIVTAVVFILGSFMAMMLSTPLNVGAFAIVVIGSVGLFRFCWDPMRE